ncbi:MAG: hypothetical protein RL751_1573, partial [Bacteroidota bacterium]
ELIGQEIEMIHLNGKRASAHLIATQTQSINVAHLPAGMYFVKVGEVVVKLEVE